MKTQVTSAGTNSVKKHHYRSVAYPTHTIQESRKLTKIIYSNFGWSVYATREQISSLIHVSPGNIQTKVSSAVQYGLLELKHKEGYKPTSLYTKGLHRPIDGEERKSLLAAFNNPSLYKKLITAFGGQILPTLKPLSNILFRNHEISESACEKAAFIFMENAKFLGLLNEENIFNIDAEVGKTNEAVEHESSQSKSDGVTHKIPVIYKPLEEIKETFIINNNDRIPFNIPLKGRRTAQIFIPIDCSPTDFNTILDWVKLMKESYVE